MNVFSIFIHYVYNHLNLTSLPTLTILHLYFGSFTSWVYKDMITNIFTKIPQSNVIDFSIECVEPFFESALTHEISKQIKNNIKYMLEYSSSLKKLYINVRTDVHKFSEKIAKIIKKIG